MEMKSGCHPSLRGAAYVASANFLARAVMLGGSFIEAMLSYEMVLLYGAHLDSHVLLFFQAVFMLPLFLLGLLVFCGVERESFNLVLYPSLMLLFLVLLRYGAEASLLIIHWDDHKLNRGPILLYYLLLDLTAISVLLLYVYTLASRPRSHPKVNQVKDLPRYFICTPPVHLEANSLKPPEVVKRRKKPPAIPPEEEMEPVPPPRPPPSPKFNYRLRRNISHLPKEESVLVEELDEQRQRNSHILLKEEDEERGDFARVKTQSLKMYEREPKRRSLLLETDLDDSGSKKSPTPPPQPEVKVEEVEVRKTEEEDESEWEYEYEEEEEEKPEVVEDPPGYRSTAV